MSSQMMRKVHKKPAVTLTPSLDLLPQLRALPWPQVEGGLFSATAGASELGHDLSHVSTHSVAPPASQPCPMAGGPRACPFGGACHICPMQIQSKQAISHPEDPLEQEADRAAEQVMQMSYFPIREPAADSVGVEGVEIHRLCHECKDDETLQAKEFSGKVLVGPRGDSAGDASGEAPKSGVASPPQVSGPTPVVQRSVEDTVEENPASAPVVSEPTVEAREPSTMESAGLLVEDDVADIAPEQMRKSVFLAQLREETCAAVAPILARVGRSVEGCPYIERWFSYYSQRSSQQIERAVRRYAPETATASNASDYIRSAVARVRLGTEAWAATGQIGGLPEGLASHLTGLGLLGAASNVIAGLAGIFSKARGGSASPVASPLSVRSQLGVGQPLDSATRARMEGAFGYDFSRVRIHTDRNAAGLSATLNARAFTLGRDVAFDAGEYQPGTLLGDALIAHELAHVVQQGAASSSVQPLPRGRQERRRLEQDADDSAVGVVASLWGDTKTGLSKFAKDRIPKLKSGLTLQRCSRGGGEVTESSPTSATQTETAKNKVSTLCEQERCLTRSGCDAASCRTEAATIADTYVRRVNAVRRPDLPNQGDIHWGWMCYQWAGLLTREFEKLSTRCWQLKWVGLVGSSGSLEHNYVFVSLGPALSDTGPVRDCGLVLDPWRTGNPIVYEGDWNWHKWNYVHNARDNTGRVYRNGRWEDVTYPPPWTPPEPAPRSP